MNAKKILLITLLFIASTVTAIYGAGLSYHSFITPISSFGELHQIHSDGWIQDGSQIKFNNLASRGNYLELNFKDWHPEGKPSAEMQFFVCGELASQIFAKKGSTQRVYIKGDCQPRVIDIKVLNPFRASETDTRDLGAQIKSIKVSSKLGVPLIDPIILLKIIVCILLLSIVVYFSFNQPYSAFFVFLILLISFFSLKNSIYLDLKKPYSLWLFFLSLSSGFLAYNLFKQREAEFKSNDNSLLYPVLLILVLIVATVFRFYGLDFGFPHYYHPDEVPKYLAIMRMVENGDLNPRYFLHPSLLLYSTYFMNNILNPVVLSGEWESTLIQAGRVVSALAGIVSVFFVYKIGSRLYSKFTGLVAAMLLAVFPLHITSSRYVKEDALLVCIILACVFVLIKSVQEEKRLNYYLAGLLAGCSAAVKYSGILSAAILGMAIWIKKVGKNSKFSFIPDFKNITWVIGALVIMPLGFVLFTPYSILDLGTFLKDFHYEKSHMDRGHTITITAWSQYWMYHFSRSMIPGMSFIGTLVATVGLGILIVRRKVSDWFILALVLLFYLPAEWVKAKPAPQPERYILPCLPFLAIAAAEAINFIRKKKGILAFILLAVVIFMPFKRSFNLASEIRNDTRSQMTEWMVSNLPQGSIVAIAWKPYAPRFLNNEFEMLYLDRSRIIPSLGIGSLKNLEADYLILPSLFYDRYFSQPNARPEQREQIRKVFRQVPIVKHMEPKYGTYGFHNPALTLFSLSKEDFSKLAEEIKLKKEGKLDKTSNEKIKEF